MVLMFKGVNLAQPKYMVPALVYLPLLFVGYMVIDMFNFHAPEKDNGMETTEYLNDKLPNANYRGDGIGRRGDAMLAEFGSVTDLTGVKEVGEDGPEEKEEYESHYTEEDLATLAENEEQEAELRRIQEQFEAMSKGGTPSAPWWGGDGKADPAGQDGPAEPKPVDRAAEAQEEARRMLEDEIARIRVETHRKLGGETPAASNPVDVYGNPAEPRDGRDDSKEATKDPGAVHALDADAESQDVKKSRRATTETFNTIADAAREPKLIKAIIDENIKAVDGSRVRLRILDDVEVGGTVLPKGSYLYATMSGFSTQRVRGNVGSVLVDDELVKISLSIYDMDGQEGLYVPQSSFQETAKDIVGGTLDNTMTIESSRSDGNSLAQWGVQAAQNAYQKVSQAISKKIKKNTAKLKYGTFVYLVNSKDIKSK